MPTDALTPTRPTPADLAELDELGEHARQFVTASKAASTRKAYRTDWTAFSTWFGQLGLAALPARPEAVATYASHLVREGLRASTVSRAMSAISQAHQMAGHQSPTKSPLVRETLRGIRRTLGTAPAQKAPVTLCELRAMVATIYDGNASEVDKLAQHVAHSCGGSPDTRNVAHTIANTRLEHAVLLVGFTGAFRRSELIALDVVDCEFGARGVLVTVRRSKTDQEGAGLVKALPYANDPSLCPVRALRAWLELASIESGAVFRSVDRWGHVAAQRMSDRAVARIVKRAAERAGLDAARFAGHSLRAGFATSAILAGKSEADTMRHTGHKSVAVFRGYVRVADAWSRNVASGLL